LIWSDDAQSPLLKNQRSPSTAFSANLSSIPKESTTPLSRLHLSLDQHQVEPSSVDDQQEEEAEIHSSTIEMESLVSALVEEDEDDSMHSTLQHLIASNKTFDDKDTDEPSVVAVDAINVRKVD
jgi:hypothetical protein